MPRASAPAPPRKRRGRTPPPPPPRSAGWRRHGRLVAAGVAAVVVAFALRLFVFPATDPITTADAVVVFTDDHDTGVEDGLALLNGGVSSTLVLVGGGGPTTQGLCGSGDAVEVVCPPPTGGAREQARAVGSLIGARGWATVALVGGRVTLTRQSLLLTRCTGATVLRRADLSDTAVAAAGDALVEAPRYFVALFLRQAC